MAIDLILKVLQALAGSQVVVDKVQRNEHVIRLLMRLGLDPEHPPADFEGVYAYSLVKYGYGKPEACLAIFREAEIRRCFREAFGRDDGAGWMREGERLLEGSVVGDGVRAVGADVRRELAEFADCFV
ncbi:MAG: NTPase (NACHT family), partial [Alkalinema sp. RU_4_3]|nr:NTPase (NACHT family) [Alkalinema sp. RU_4_3]